ncbi:MAG: site-specific DNA-methyltransferase [Deltaproteobacteria bacterium]|nr:site-specific DNA-methyltransferase [Deltaproteobacteria bacterium]
MTAAGWENQLYFGDNLEILREHIPVASVDLIYLDPPFNSKATYNMLFKEPGGEQSPAQVAAFEDTWKWGPESDQAFHEVMTLGPKKLADLMESLRSFLGVNNMMAYLIMMAVRLVEMHRVLKPTGSLYLHCDPTASHYLKLILDAVFNVKYFRNEIIWKRTSGHSDARRYGRVHDVILYYSRGNDFTWNLTQQTYDESYVEQYYRYQDADGRRWMSDNLSAAGLTGGGYEYEWKGIKRVWRCPVHTMERLEQEGRIFYTKNGIPRLKRYLDESSGLPVQDIWTDIEALRSWHKERLEYPTQKPESLLERIIRTSSNEGDLVLDPFCGCGTAVAVAERLKRRWLGIDITHLAIALIKQRLFDTFEAELCQYAVIGEPVDVPSAQALARQNRHEFEKWALGLVYARPAKDKVKGADAGIDGVIHFTDDPSGKYKKMVIQVKSGHVSVSQVRDLKGVMEREKAAIGALITLKSPTRQMRDEAAEARHYEPESLPGLRFPRLQIITIAELFAGNTLLYPRLGAGTFKKAPRKRKGPSPEEKQGELKEMMAEYTID